MKNEKREKINKEKLLEELGETPCYVQPAITKIIPDGDDVTNGETPEVVIKK